MSDEDFEPFVGGPPPDPSERTWRHPSEIAAQANAQSMAELSEIQRGRRTLFGWRPTNTGSFLVAGSLGAAACLTAVGLFQLSFTGEPTSVAGQIDLTSPADAITSAEVDADPAGRAVATSSAPSTTLLASTHPTEVTPNPAMPIVSPVAGAVADEQLIGITIGAELVAGGVLVDGYLITSASAVGNRLSVSYDHRGASSLAYLVGIDPFSDLAVFRPSAESRAGRTLEALSTNLTDLAGSSDEPWVQPFAELGDPVTTATPTHDGVRSSTGVVLATDRDATTSDGQSLIGLIDTSIRQPDILGGALVDADGGLVGIVIDTSSSLASAVPVRDAVMIADRLSEQGWANETWVGFIGVDRETGVEVIDVTTDGPAATAGLLPGDIIRFLDGAPIDHMGGVTAGLRRAVPGDTIIMVVDRAGTAIALRVEALAYEPRTTRTEPADPPPGGSTDPTPVDPESASGDPARVSERVAG